MKRFIAMLLCSVLVLALVIYAAPKSITKPDTPQKTEITAKADDYSAVYKTLSKLQNDTMRADKSKAGIFNGFAADGAEPDMAVMETAESEVAAPAAAADEAYYGTNVQVDGIDEADIVKTDGKYIYAVKENNVLIYRAAGENSVLVKTLAVGDDEYTYPSDIYISSGKLVVICSSGLWCVNDCVEVSNSSRGSVPISAPLKEKTEIYIYDVSSPESASLIKKLAQDGYCNTSRLYGGKLYMITNYYVYNEIVRDEPKTYVPCTYCDDTVELVPSNCIEILPEAESTSYCVCASYDLDTCELADTESILGGVNLVYMSENAIYLTKSEYEDVLSEEYEEDGYTVVDHSSKNYTDIYRIGFENGLEMTASGRVEGYLDSQFSLDEFDGSLRVVTTNNYENYSVYTDKKHKFENYEWHDSEVQSDNALYVLDSSLNEISSVTGLAQNEYVYSVRFDGTFVYFCTFRQTDPLFAVDLSNVKDPKIVSEYKINGFSDYLHVWDDKLLFGLGMEADSDGRTSGLKLVMFDISDKADVKARTATVLDNSYTEALYNHKALLIVPEKNLVGFQCGDEYCVYSYTGDGFVLKQTVSVPEEWGQFRGVLIGDCIYAVYNSGLSVISLTDFSIVQSISVSE